MKKQNQLVKCFTVLLSIAMIMSIMPFAVSAADVASGSCGKNVDWTLDSKGTLTISGSGDMNDFYIPSPWNSHKDKISKVVILPGVTNIGIAAFMNCDKITDVTIPDSVTSIKMSAFRGCTFETISIPNSVTTIASTAFSIKDKFNIILDEGNKIYHIDGNCLIETV